VFTHKYDALPPAASRLISLWRHQHLGIIATLYRIQSLLATAAQDTPLLSAHLRRLYPHPATRQPGQLTSFPPEITNCMWLIGSRLQETVPEIGIERQK